jgi:hypothetical protein
MKGNKLIDNIGYIIIFLMIISLFVLSLNHFIGDPIGIHK